jgi:hypothetical protein
MLVAQAGKSGLAVRHAHRLEAGRAEVARHALGDHVVVLDDQDLRHGCIMQAGRAVEG